MGTNRADKQISQQELAIMGVSLTMIARVGDKTFHAAVSPVDFTVFKKDFYRDMLYANLIKQLEVSLDNDTKASDLASERLADSEDVTNPPKSGSPISRKGQT